MQVNMVRVINYTIAQEDEGLSVERFLRSKNYTRQSITQLKKYENNTVIAGEWVHINHVLKCGDVLTVTIHEDETSAKIPPVNLPISIVYEDEDIIVVNKPAKMPIHPSLNNYENTLGNALEYYFRQKGEKLVFRCINRLDRDTTGLTIIAKHYLAAGILHKQMAKREIKREYLAIVTGEDISDSGIINAPIGRVDDSTIERRIDYEHGETAITHYEVLERKGSLALVKLHLDTGRTHQIRVHMKLIGHPLIGDFLYNPEDEHMTRQALHSYKLSFVHPITGEQMNFAVDLPEDMKVFFVLNN